MASSPVNSEREFNKRSLSSLAPNLRLTSYQLLCRCILLLNNTIGIGLCFAAGARESEASGFVAGSYQASSLLILPILIGWNARQLRQGRTRSSPAGEHPETGDDYEAEEKPAGVKMLRFAVVMDALGFLYCLIVYPFMVQDASEAGRGWYPSGSGVLFSYASVSILIGIIIHIILLFSQSRQLYSRFHARRKARDLRCPHCHHAMTSQSVFSGNSTTSLVDNARHPASEEANLLTYNDDVTGIVNMTVGQETGICTRTPLVFASVEDTSSQRTRANSQSFTANEQGEGEGDRLIEKSK